ncbi:type III-A CRISPR-associated RAMP protein Csm4 [uncultured Paludibaculum sp.]|uniref:type III-A CRISPR-associated RAMP protein Csm4 n=1 Tax=uncultured Paludibaculum sp. TaxID=1765020 RepID=UPI002AAA7821|nr:hypothetical protein [uncultured Paludibaculum sp.]
MNPALLIRLRPTTPWRIGPDTGARDQAVSIFHSDALYSALCSSFEQLGLLEEWLNATAQPHSEPAVRFSSCFPWQRGHLYAPPPAGLWPPPAGPAVVSKVRWKGATLVPTSLIAGLVRGEWPSDEQWIVDGHSGCLIPGNSRSSTGPFRFVQRSSAAVDRVTGGQIEPHRVTCVQYAPASGLWCAAQFSNPITYAVWAPKLQAAFRLLADTGLGGLRSRGFGRFRTPDFQPGILPELLFGAALPGNCNAYWLLSLFSPAESDTVEWTAGDYLLTRRTGRVGPSQGGGQQKLASRMVAEGSVLLAGRPPLGSVRDVAPPGCPHPVYRSGYAVALPIPWPVTA